MTSRQANEEDMRSIAPWASWALRLKRHVKCRNFGAKWDAKIGQQAMLHGSAAVATEYGLEKKTVEVVMESERLRLKRQAQKQARAARNGTA